MSTQRSGETSCLGQIDGKQCRTFLGKETNFCTNCGTRNPAKIATDDQVKSADTNQNEQEKATLSTCSSGNIQGTDKSKSDQKMSTEDESAAGEEITDSDEVAGGEDNDKIFKTTSADLKKLEDEVSTDKSIGSIEKDVFQILKEKGPEASIEYITESIDSWKKTTVKIAVAGKSAVGKSAFINAIRGVTKTDKDYAIEGFGDTTMEVQEWPHPKNKQIIYCDLPGYGTVTINREKFLKKVKLLDFDMFLIFVYPVPTEDDDWLVKQLNKAGRQFCFVRAKLDRDIKSAGKKMGLKEEKVIEEIRKKIKHETENMPSSNRVEVFCISNKNMSIGEIQDLIIHMKGKIPTLKFEAIIFSLSAFVDEVINIKYKILKDRIFYVSFQIAIHMHIVDRSAILVPAFSEINLYFDSFFLNKVSYSTIPNLKHPFSYQYIHETLLLYLKDKIGGGFRQFVPFYNIYESHRVCSEFFKRLLDELKEDYYTVQHYLRNEAISKITM
ncbi:interferon-gamma-inducible GTPase 10-like [Mytilus edulis]|uniref:interferon-gamma-inducible GTPase 10-like n=1 Tax=Mytilus edulis TaxID=6550 RepID=UPI0039EED912